MWSLKSECIEGLTFNQDKRHYKDRGYAIIQFE